MFLLPFHVCFRNFCADFCFYLRNFCADFCFLHRSQSEAETERETETESDAIRSSAQAVLRAQRG